MYDKTGKSFCDIHAKSDYSTWTPAEVMSALVAVPGVYEPFSKDEHVYNDALLNRGIRDLFRKLRDESPNTLFWHMNREGRKGSTLYVKGHKTKRGTTRIVQDFSRFIGGLSNNEFDEHIEEGLFGVRPDSSK